MKFNKKFIFITLFAVLYLCVGLVSTIHAISFFGLANTPILGTILAVTFEIGQAAVLFNLLTSPSQRKRIMPWALMCILTLVQILGNIFSSYKYLITNSNSDLRYFKEPIFTWTDLPDQQCNVIITYIVGAILPIVALCLTEMVVSYLNSDEEENDKQKSVDVKPAELKPQVIEDDKEPAKEEPVQESVQNKEAFNEVEQTEKNEQEPATVEPVIAEDTKEAIDEMLTGPVKQEVTAQPKTSHFINI